MLTLYDAARCPYCARVRIVLAEKEIEYEPVEIDLSDRPAWLYVKNPKGKVPVLEEDAFVLPESHLVMEYLEERHPEPALLPPDPAERALVRLRIDRFDDELGDAYYAFRRGDADALDLSQLELPESGFTLADVAYLPWVLRARDVLGVSLPAHVAAWAERLSARASVAAELELLAALA